MTGGYRIVHRLLRALVWIAVLAAIILAGLWMVRNRPGDLPGTPLDLGDPVGVFTGRKLAGLTQDHAQCLALLDRAGIAYTALDAHGDDSCRAEDQVRLGSTPPLSVALSPANVAPSCPVAAGLAMWTWNVVQPAAEVAFGTRVVRIDHFGSYACRRLYGRSEGAYSEHATADAIDVAGFVLADGRRIRVAADWGGDDADARFLHAVRDGACDLFATVLSPDYNAAHADHLHLDQADRGAMGWRACR